MQLGSICRAPKCERLKELCLYPHIPTADYVAWISKPLGI